MEKAIADCCAIEQFTENLGCLLFVARKRKIRPQGACYPKNKELWPLFDACGPKRDVGFGNPYERGEYKKDV